MSFLQKIAKVLNPNFNLPRKIQNQSESKEIDTYKYLEAIIVSKAPNKIQITYHTGLVNKSFFIMRLILIVMGRWPFSLQSISKNSQDTNFGKTKTVLHVGNYVSNLKSFPCLYFGMTTLFLSFVLVMCTLGFFDLFWEWDLLPGFKWANLDKITLKRNLVSFLLVWGCLLHGTLSSVAMFIDRKRWAENMNYWNYAVENLKIREMKSHRNFLIMVHALSVLSLIYIAYTFKNVKLVRDSAALFGFLAWKPFLSESQFKSVEGMVLSIFGIFVIIYAVYTSEAFLFMFSFKCRILRSLFQEWNKRLASFLSSRSSETTGERLESDKLMKDMITLLTMVKQIERLFSTSLTSYYAIQLLNLCFELFILAKSGTDDFTRSGSSERRIDIISALITLFQNVYFFFTVSFDGASVGEEAAKGLDVIREHPLCPDWTVQRKYLVYNLGVIYHQKIAISGAKFFVIDRPLIITVLGSVITHFVIIIQVEPLWNNISDKIG